MVRAATAHAAIPIRKMRFEEFNWDHAFDGIWARASLLHVAHADLPEVIRRLADHLVADDILYASFRIGSAERQENGCRFTDLTAETPPALLDECRSLSQIEIWRTEDRHAEKKKPLLVKCIAKKNLTSAP